MTWRSRAMLALVLGVCLGVPLQAQNSGQSNLVATSTTCPGNGCLTVNVNGMTAAAFQLSGTWTGTVSLTGSVDGANFVALNVIPISGTATAVTTVTANGAWSATIGGLVAVRAAVTTPGTGTIQVAINSADLP